MSKRIELKRPEDIERMRRGAAILAETLDMVVESVRPGISTLELDDLALEALTRRKLKPAFLGLYGFPGTMCISVNHEVVHGIPSASRVLAEGDIVSLDIGLILEDFYTDMARTVPVGEIDEASRRLIEVTTESLDRGIETLREGNRMGDTSAAIQHVVEAAGFSVVREYTGHGIGRGPHEDPKIPNYGTPGRGVRWQPGMVVCLEPMVNAGTHTTRVLEDQWTVVTTDGARSAHMEHTIAITEKGPEVLTDPSR